MVYEMRGYRIIYKMRGPEKVKKVFPGGKLGGEEIGEGRSIII